MVNSSIGTFLRQPELFKNESMHSYLHRYLIANHYDSLQTFESVLSKIFREKVKNLTTLPSKEEFNALFGEFLGLSPLEVENATLQRFKGMIPFKPNYSLIGNWKKILIPSETDGDSFRNSKTVVFCPHCLQKGNYFRIQWYLKCYTICFDHLCYLIDKCPKCHSQVSEDDVINSVCPHCSCNLSKCKTDYIGSKPDDVALAKIINNWLKIDINNTKNYGLPKEENWKLFRVFSGLVGCIRAKKEWNEPEPIIDNTYYSPEGYKMNHPFVDDIQQNHRRMVMAMKVLVKWPNNFNSFLDSYRIIDEKKPINVDIGLGILYEFFIDRKWKTFPFIQKTFNDYLLLNQPIHYYNYEKTKRHEDNPNLVNNFLYIEKIRACQYLNLFKLQVDNLISNKILNLKISEWPNCKDELLYRDEVMILAEKRLYSVNLNEAVEILGTDDQTILELMNRGYLVAVGGKTIDGAQKWLITKESIQIFRKQISSVILKTNMRQYISLGKLARKTAIFSITTTEIISLVINGDIEAFILEGEQISLDALLFPQDTYFKIKQLLLNKNNWITLRNFAQEVNVKRSTVFKWRNAGLVKPVVSSRSICFFSKDTLIQFQNEFITTNQAAQILGVGPLTVQKWARNERLKPISGAEIDGCHDYRFKRSDVEFLSQEKRITAPQMARKIGLSRSQMCQWIKKGKATPISGPGIDGMKHYLFVE